MFTKYFLWKTIQNKDPMQPVERQFSYYEAVREAKPVSKEEMICRVCTSPADIPLTETIGDINIINAIGTVANVWITQNDSTPKFICQTCLEELKIALAFKRKCEYFDRKLSMSSPERIDPPPMIFHDFAQIIKQMHERKRVRKKSPQPESIQSSDSTTVEEEPITMKNKEKIIKENKRTKAKKTKKKSAENLKCKHCDTTFDSKEQLREHVLQHNGMPSPCPICGKVVMNLTRHKRIVHLHKNRFACHVCGKLSNTNEGMRLHLLIHSDKYEFKCKLCPYKGKQKAYLTQHMRIHTGERPYLCTQCPLKFVNHSNLLRHQLTHTNKKFECRVCKKQFRLESRLKEHYDAAHLNLRYRCTICGRELWSRSTLLSHELKVHKRQKNTLYDAASKVVVVEEGYE